MRVKLIARIIFLASSCYLPQTFAAQELAPVSGYIRAFFTGKKVANANVLLMETKEVVTTDKEGRFGPILYPVGKELTLLFSKPGYPKIQSETVVVPREGLTGRLKEITFQVVTYDFYYALLAATGARFEPKKCHVITTILAPGKTLEDLPQGEANAVVSLTPTTSETPFYFDIFTSGPLKNKTNPFTRGLKMTTLDGGAAYFNLPVSAKPYIITAQKQGVKFSAAQFKCTQDALINISPPRGPMASYL